jgi:hypothetical protein
MDSEYLQSLRNKLQKRVRNLNSTGFEVYHHLLKQFWGFLQSYPIFIGIFEDLAHRCPTMEEEVQKMINGKEGLIFHSELENSALSYFVIKKCIESEDNLIEAKIGRIYDLQASKHNVALERYNDIFLETLYEYLDEYIDDQRAILALLRRYKHKCEWFQRDNLIKLSELGERKLAEHLYEYLYDQGLNFVIEPKSASGEADLISIQKGEEPLIADAKIFNPEKSKGKSYIATGFNQIYTYTRDYNEPFGYLIIYKTCEEEPKFLLANQTQSTPFVTHNNKTIFLITIDIFQYEDTASKRGTLKTIGITEDDLIKEAKQTNE